MFTRERFGPYVERLRAEIVKLSVLIAITAAAFVGIRALSASVTEVRLKDAAEWYARGQAALAGGDVATAIQDFRHAVDRRRGHKAYSLALADALAMGDQAAAAERILLSLRQISPEDPDINLDLARLAADRGDLARSVRYYQSALYAPSPPGGGPRAVRLELIQLLLKHGEAGRALSELIAATDDAGDDPAMQVRLATLVLEAGDVPRALAGFRRALTLDPGNVAAAAGAGTAAFRIGDYETAERYLASVPDRPDLADMRTTAALVRSRDPLADRIRASERRRRLAANITYVRMRLVECTAGLPAPDPSFSGVRQTIEGIEARLKRGGSDPDLVDDGVAVVFRAEGVLGRHCGPATPLDRALVIIGERHGGNEA
jgi:predicted Zn-dependent protease